MFYPHLLGACLDWFTMAFAIRCGSVSLFSPIEHPRRGQTKMVYRIFLLCIFLFKYLSTDDALNYPKSFFIRSRQMPSFHSSHFSGGLFHCKFISLNFIQIQKVYAFVFYWRTRFVSVSVNICRNFHLARVRSQPQLAIEHCRVFIWKPRWASASIRLELVLFFIADEAEERTISFFLLLYVNWQFSPYSTEWGIFFGNQEFRLFSFSSDSSVAHSCPR